MNKNDSYIKWKNWSDESFAVTSKLEELYFKNIFQILKINKTSKILEIGFGNGSFIGFANSQNYYCDGVEKNKLLVELATKRGYSAYSSIDEMDKTLRYDIIILFDVIEHILPKEIESFLKKISFYLEHDGSIFLRFPNGSSPLGLANQHGDETHVNIVTLSKLDYWCYNSNLKVVFYRGDIRPFIFMHNWFKLPSKVLKLVLFKITERLIRFISNQSKGILSSNLEVVLKKSNDS
jgi:2-polyprenyl-3-methyl-5-hydroxy-6-metoxy-1,4-benzoquinol methylase